MQMQRPRQAQRLARREKIKKGVKTWFCLPEGLATLKGNALSVRKKERHPLCILTSCRQRERARQPMSWGERESAGERLCNVICLLIMLSSISFCKTFCIMPARARDKWKNLLSLQSMSERDCVKERERGEAGWPGGKVVDEWEKRHNYIVPCAWRIQV